jgi:hypothetical protein
MLDWHLWPIYIIGVLMWIPVTPVGYYLQLSYRQLGFSTIQANLLAVPYGVLSIINLIIIAIISELFDNRSFTGMIQFVVSPAYAYMTFTHKSVDHTVSDCSCGYPERRTLAVLCHLDSPTWISLRPRHPGGLVLPKFRIHPNPYSLCFVSPAPLSPPLASRSVDPRLGLTFSLYNMAVQLSQIIGSNIYQASDAPRYVKGNTVLLVICGVCLVLYPLTYVFYRTINSRREAKWSAMSEEQKSTYLSTTKDEGSRRLDFRFAT